MNNFSFMARFNAWANERLYGVVADLSDADYREDRKAFFGSIHNTLNHLLVGDRLWLARIEGIEHEIRALDQILHDDFEALWEARRAEDERFTTLVDFFAEARLSAPVTFRRMAGGGGEMSLRLDRILLTLINHQTHHRGQVHAMLTAGGVTPLQMDVIDFMGETGTE
ncbi:MAG TPA: DinB family protein [Rhodospirillales bacterium]|jgi:uncharacterized damage-inducible protein DinB|nr:DinB family protein [Rhodospirillales bacterium]